MFKQLNRIENLAGKPGDSWRDTALAGSGLNAEEPAHMEMLNQLEKTLAELKDVHMSNQQHLCYEQLVGRKMRGGV